MSSKPPFIVSMVALTNVTVSGVDYAPGDTFTLSDPSTMRWMMDRKAARSATLEDAGQVVTGVAVKASDGTTNTTEGTQRGQESAKATKRTGGAAASK